MSLAYSAIVDGPIEEVFAWHARPGALTRLIPPWQPMRVGSESASLRDGTAVLLLPGGLRWLARHDPAGFDPPHRFVDRLATPGLRTVVRWRHTHTFSPDGPDRTRIDDRVETVVPGRVLTATFAYRERQLTGDLSAHRGAAARGSGPLTVAVTGSAGLVGTALSAFLTTGGHRVIRLVRRASSSPDERTWDPGNPAPDLLSGVDHVVHLAGASIAGRFTAAHKRAIYDSRIEPTRRLAEVAAATRVSSFVSASAIGFYGADRGDEVLTESTSRGDGFLADVVADWEAATAPADEGGVRVAQIRTGIVQSPNGGTLQLFRPLFSIGLGGRLGSGEQWLSWIGIDDLLDVYYRALTDPAIAGPVNAVAPAPVRNAEYTRVLAHVLRRPALLPVPSLGPRLLLGAEGGRELAGASQCVEPAVLLGAGHAFRHPDLEPALRHLLGRVGNGSDT